jgi:putative NIF3 family GTP cyclohydrolase 1 type 2
MTIKEIYKLAVQMGKDADFRTPAGVDKALEHLNKRFQSWDQDKKEDFDQERLVNPYSDSRILFGDPDKKVEKILVGIDIDGEELLLAEKMGIDLAISHHPRGQGLAGLDDVMQLQIDILNFYGVPVNIAEKLLNKRIAEVTRSISSANHNRAVDMARHLKIPLVCLHTPCDNLVADFIKKHIEKEDPMFVGDLMSSLKKIPEYKEAIKIGAGPEIFVGNPDNRCGKIVITEVTGGTEGAPEIYEKLAQAGAGTVVGMHMSEKHREEAEKACVNVVVAGHISSDSIGLNLFLDQLEKRGIEIIPTSGLIRVSRL